LESNSSKLFSHVKIRILIEINDLNIIFRLFRTLAALAIGGLVGGIYFNQPDNAASAGNRVNTILFLMCVFSLFCLPAISKFIEERLLFQREHASGFIFTN
jgi:hypothetical protein